MTERCFSPDDLDRAARLRSDEPGWDHIATCPRCRARIIAYRAFSAPGEIPVEADLPVARTYLSRALDRVVYGGEEIAAEVTPDADGRSGGAARRGGQHRVGQHHRIWRPALALAAVLCLAVGLELNRRTDFWSPPPGDNEQILRGDPASQQEVFALRVVPGPDEGSLRLEWDTPAKTDASQVVLFNGGLEVLARFDTGAATYLVLRTSEVPAADEVSFARVVFFRGGDEIASGQVRTLELP